MLTSSQHSIGPTLPDSNVPILRGMKKHSACGMEVDGLVLLDPYLRLLCNLSLLLLFFNLAKSFSSSFFNLLLILLLSEENFVPSQMVALPSFL